LPRCSLISTPAFRESLQWQPCVRCGALGLDARPNGSVVLLVCPHCGNEEERRRLPFFSVTGPSGSGKTTLVRRLWRELPECVTLDGDLLWNPGFWNDREGFYTLWLTAAGQISQSGRPVVLCTAAIPEDWRTSEARPLVGDVHMLALVCAEEDLRSRLRIRARPLDSEAPADFLDQTCVFNGWLRERLPYVDTSTLQPDDTAAQVAAWVRSHL
jgi:hypothetical protein